MIGRVLWASSPGPPDRARLRFTTLETLGKFDEDALVYWDRDRVWERIPHVDTDLDPNDEVPRIYREYPCVDLVKLGQREWNDPVIRPAFSVFVGPKADSYRDPIAVYLRDEQRWLLDDFLRAENVRERLIARGMTREQAKRVEWGLSYGMGADKLRKLVRG